jgi:hypothetical protein
MIMNIRDLIRSADGGGDVGEVAKVVLHKILDDLSSEDQMTVLQPLVRSEVVRLRRHRIRREEDAAFTAVDDMTALRTLRDAPFTDVITHSSITWGQATRKQHLARARWLRNSHIKPIQQTANRHETAAALISQRHVQKLDDLPEFGEAA